MANITAAARRDSLTCDRCGCTQPDVFPVWLDSPGRPLCVVCGPIAHLDGEADDFEVGPRLTSRTTTGDGCDRCLGQGWQPGIHGREPCGHCTPTPRPITTCAGCGAAGDCGCPTTPPTNTLDALAEFGARAMAIVALLVCWPLGMRLVRRQLEVQP